MQYAELDAGTKKAMTDVFSSISTTMLGLADNLGLGLSDRVKNYIIPQFTVDLKGLSGEDAAKKLNGVISTALDTMSNSVFGDILGQYQQLGEGMLETAVRVVAEVAVVKDALDSSGIYLADNTIAIADSIAQAAGGLKEFQTQFAAYFDKFYSDTEKTAKAQSTLAMQLNSVNLALSANREAYRKQVEAIDVTTEAGQKQYSMMIKLAGTADSYYSAIEDLAEKANDLLARQKAQDNNYQTLIARELDLQSMGATNYTLAALTETRKEEIKALDASLQFMQKVIWSVSDLIDANKKLLDARKADVAEAMLVLKNAVDLEKAAVKTKYDDLITIATTALDTLKASIPTAFSVLQKSVETEKARLDKIYNDSLATTQQAVDAVSKSVSSLTAIANALKSAVNQDIVKNTLRTTAQGQIKDALNTGKLDETIITNALAIIAKPSEDLFTTFVDYQRDALITAKDISDLSALANSQLTGGTTQLEALNIQIINDRDAHEAEMKSLDDILVTAQAQIDAAMGTTVAVMSITEAQALLTKATETAGKQQQDSGAAQIEAYKKASEAEIKRLDQILIDTQKQIDAANGITHAVLTVNDAVISVKAAIEAQTRQAAQAATDLAARMSAVEIAKAATAKSDAAKLAADSAASDAALAAKNSSSAIAKADADKAAALAATTAANAMVIAAVPKTTIAGQTDNPIWESVLTDFIARHQAQFGKPMGRSWDADPDAQHQYADLVARYNGQALLAIQAAKNSAAALTATAEQSAALVPALAATAASSQAAAEAAAAASAATQAYTTATQAAATGAYIEGATATGYQSSAGASYSAATGNVTDTTGAVMAGTSIQEWVKNMLAVGNPRAIYDEARLRGISATSLDSLMGWAIGTSNGWATSNGLPAFAKGGDHKGGWRIVGENGPELENTGPSRIHSNAQSKSLVDNSELIAEIKALREEVKAGQLAIAANTRKTAKILQDVTQDGISVSTTVAA